MEKQTKVVTVDELMLMKPPNPRIEIGRDKLRNLRGTQLELAEHTDGKLCPVCKVLVEQKLLKLNGTGQYWEVPNGSTCPECGILFEHNRWKFSNLHGRYAYLYQFNPELDKYDWSNYFIYPISRFIYISIVAVGESYRAWREGVYGGGHHEWRNSREVIAIPMTLEMVGCNGEDLVTSIHELATTKQV